MKTRLLLLFVVGLLAALLPTRATAQVTVQLQLTKRIYMAYEPMTATVTVTNRTGKDFILGGSGGQSWLSFNVLANAMESIQPVAGGYNAEPVVLGAGKSIQKSVSLGKYYPLGSQGNYSIRANVYYHEFQQHFVSTTQGFTVSEGNMFWEQTAGLNDGSGLPGSTTYRKFQLLSFQDAEQMTLYVRLRDERARRVVACYPLGRLVPHRDPQATLDGENRLHVLYMAGPKLFAHTVVAADGEKLQQDLFEEKGGSSPRLMLSNNGSVGVRGGLAYDPNAPPAEQQERIHRLTDRPPGLPTGPE